MTTNQPNTQPTNPDEDRARIFAANETARIAFCEAQLNLDEATEDYRRAIGAYNRAMEAATAARNLLVAAEEEKTRTVMASIKRNPRAADGESSEDDEPADREPDMDGPSNAERLERDSRTDMDR